ncbi:hypothetical protein BGP75_16200 [Motiliproteus sp. MSK22-1]|nr:hypothetical protein BGP75_16200 [Motiliproteus sp. MSK22-1]
MVILFIFIAGCAAKKNFRVTCASELDVAWKELDIAKAKGFSGTVSYTKAAGLLSLAKSMQTVENFDNCVRHVKDARYYIKQSRLGR